VTVDASESARIVALEAVTADLRSDVSELKVGMNELQKEIKADIRDIHDKLANRPSWAVTVIITLLTGACGALSSALIALS
jgi:hypothetical protein